MRTGVHGGTFITGKLLWVTGHRISPRLRLARAERFLKGVASPSQPIGFLPMTICQRQLRACTSTGSICNHPIAAMSQTIREANSEQRLVKLKCLAQRTAGDMNIILQGVHQKIRQICTIQTWSPGETIRLGVVIFRHRRTDETLAHEWPSHFDRAIAAGATTPQTKPAVGSRLSLLSHNVTTTETIEPTEIESQSRLYAEKS